MTLDNNKAHELFNAARNLPSAEREPFLDKECAENDSLRGEVEALLEYHFTSAQTVQPNEQSSDTTLDYQRGDMIGSFKILNVLGEGGMGIVYLAEQSKPVKRRVALKVIKAGMDTKQVIARFEAERQALAIMNHPGIAQVYEAGVTEHGRPYFVMEHVKGMPITDACDELKFTTKQRLELMAKVCDAVQHAHSKMIIHRDLKPSNILVDANGETKIIDFGVAKAMTFQLTEKTLVTQVGHFVGTPVYMSPEQADLKAIDIDAKTDVYALGVVLYEVLTGMPPFDPQTLRDAGLEKMREIIRTQLPPKPSTQLSSISDGDDATKIAEARQTQIAALAGLLRKELEWIPLKALKKLRSERYDSAKSMGDDIRRYLAGEALEAGPDSTIYKFKKTLRKHKGLFIAAAIVFLVLFGGIITTTTESIRANKQAAIAEQQRASALQQAYYGNIHAADAAIDKDELRVARRRLDKARSALNTANSDLMPFEWKYLNAMKDDSIAVLMFSDAYPGRSGTSIAFAPDGSRFASGHYDGTVRIWDAVRREVLASWEGVQGSGTYVTAIAFSPDGSRIVSGDNGGTAYVWDTGSGEELAVLDRGEDGAVLSVAFSPDGSRIVTCGKSSATVANNEDYSDIMASASTPDLVLGTIRMWDATSYELLPVNFNVQAWGIVQCLAFSPDGSNVVIGHSNGVVQILDADSGEELAVRDRGEDGAVLSIAFSPDGSRIVFSTRDGAIRIWQSEAEKAILDPEYVSKATSDLDARLRAAELRISQLSGQNQYLKKFLNNHDDQVTAVAFSPDGSRIVSCSKDGTIRIWDAASREELAVLKGHESGVNSIAFSPDGLRIVSGGMDNTIRIWDAGSEKELGVLTDGVNRKPHIIRAMAFSPDGSRLFTSGSGGIRIWDTGSEEELATIDAGDMWNDIAFSPDGSRLFTATQMSIWIWDAGNGEPLAGWNTLPDRPSSVVISPDGSRILYQRFDYSVTATARDEIKDIVIRDTDSEKELAVLDHSERAICLAFSPDGSRIVSGNYDGTIRIWDAGSGEELATIKGHDEGGVLSVAFSPDGSLLASSGRLGMARIWDTASKEELTTIEAGSINVMAFSPDGSRLFTSGNFLFSSGLGLNVIRIWDTGSGEELAVLRGHEDLVMALAFSPDGSLLASGSRDGVVRLWNTKSKGMVAKEQRLAKNRIADLSPIVTTWFEKTDGDSELVLSMLDREVKNRPPEEVITLRNLVLKKLVELRQAKQMQDSE